MMWKFDRLSKGQRDQVITLFEAEDLDGIHAIYSEAGVYPPGFCNLCKRNMMIRQWTIYAIEVLWKE